MATQRRETRPILDSINDAVAALTDVVRSVRGTSQGKQPADMKTRARAVGKEVQRGASEVSAEVRRAGRILRAHFDGAWDALTSHHGASSDGNAARSPRTPRPRRQARR